MEKWFVTMKKADFEEWGRQYGISPILARIIRNRDVVEYKDVEKYLNGSLTDCYSPFLLKDMEPAVTLVQQAIAAGTQIRVIGDYDVDGICASYCLTKGLQSLGARVDTVIPHRIKDGYGLNENLIQEAHEDGIGMIITCDNGIAASSQVQLAKEYGMQVIVTDHHEVPFTTEEVDGAVMRHEILPPADAVIDPKQEQCGYPFPGICGAVVAYKLIQACVLGSETGDYADLLEELLEFAAFATICDVMELRDENRILVREGLKRLKNSRNAGLRALMEVNQIEADKLNVYHFGFVMGPCINATGRLDTAKRALELLQSKTRAEAVEAASELKALNDSRKNLTLQGVEQAIAYVEEKGVWQDKVMIIYLPEVHESLAGIIAGRIREKYNHPVFLLTKGEEGVKGSGRSIEGYHMYEAMTECASYFTKFGGHAMAAGLSMEEEQIEPLRQELNRLCTLTEEDFIPKVHIDIAMPVEYATRALADELELLEPYGVGNPKPLFAQQNLLFLSGIKMGASKNVAKYRVLTPNGNKAELTFFGDSSRLDGFLDEKYGPGSADRLYAGQGSFQVSVTYQVSLNTFRGNTNVQLIMQNFC